MCRFFVEQDFKQQSHDSAMYALTAIASWPPFDTRRMSNFNPGPDTIPSPNRSPTLMHFDIHVVVLEAISYHIDSNILTNKYLSI